MSTFAVPRSGSAAGDHHHAALCRHLNAGLAELLARSATPAWVADTHGQVVFANLAAGHGNNELDSAAAACIAAACKSGRAPARGHDSIGVSPLLDGHGRRLGWLATHVELA